MDLKWVLAVAIEQERKAADGYAALAQEAEDKGARKLFLRMVKEEKQHLAALKEVDPESVGGFLPKPSSFRKIRECLSQSPVADSVSIRDALHLAIEKEKRSQELYVELAQAVKDEAARDMFRTLSAMEKQHLDWLELLTRD
jgi:rubrerythrin